MYIHARSTRWLPAFAMILIVAGSGYAALVVQKGY